MKLLRALKDKAVAFAGTRRYFQIAIALAMFLFLACSFLGMVPKAHAQSPYAEARAAVRRLSGEHVYCSGVMIEPHLMLTAAHCFTQGHEALSVDGKGEPVKVLKLDTDLDLALVQTTAVCPCARVGHVPAQLDEPVVAVGFPMYPHYLVQVLTHGFVQGHAGNQVQITAQLAPGASGGGVFARRGGHWVFIGVNDEIVAFPQGMMDGVVQSPLTYMASAVDLKAIRHFLHGEPK